MDSVAERSDGLSLLFDEEEAMDVPPTTAHSFFVEM